jgi:hypothetical protein
MNLSLQKVENNQKKKSPNDSFLCLHMFSSIRDDWPREEKYRLNSLDYVLTATAAFLPGFRGLGAVRPR